jgi:histidinol-phosphate aminotransferase
MGMTPDMVVDFSVSVNPLGPPLEVHKALSNLDFSSYPDIENLVLREAVAQQTGINPGQIVFGNGTMELINLLTQAYLQKSDAVFILGPTFSEYEMAARRKNAEVIYLNATYREGFNWDITHTSKKIRLGKPKLVFLCNPNNPTGVYLSQDTVSTLLEAVGEGLLVLDEAYVSFVHERWDATTLLQNGNIVILRSMTKDYGLAALRLGYALCHPDVADAIVFRQPAWSVNAAAQVAGAAALSDKEYLPKARKLIMESKDYLIRELELLGLRVCPTAANFLLVKVGNAKRLRYELLEHGMCVRDCSSFGLPEFIRVGVRTLPECMHLISVLKGYIKTHQFLINS